MGGLCTRVVESQSLSICSMNVICMSQPKLTQPIGLRTKSYISGADKLNGHDLWAMFKACMVGDNSRVKELIAKDERLVRGVFWYQTPFHQAVRHGHTDLVRLLLRKGADPGVSPFLYDSWNKLLKLAKDRSYVNIEQLLIKAMQKQFNYSAEFSRLALAIESRDIRKVNRVVSKHPDLINAADALGNNALHYSVQTRQLEMIDRFVELGTPIDAVRADGRSPAIYALSFFRPLPKQEWLKNRFVVIGSLLAHGAEYSISLAAANGDYERVEQLLDKNPSLATSVDVARVSPLSYAAREGHTDICEMLLDRKANPNRPEDLCPDGRALFEACWTNKYDTAKLLLERGADPNAGMDSSGCCLTIVDNFHGKAAKPLIKLLRKHAAQTPPYIMTTQQMKQAVIDNDPILDHCEFLGNLMAKRNSELLELYINSSPKNLRQMQYGGGGCYPESPKLVCKLLEDGLNPNQTDWQGRTFLHQCAENFDTSVAAEFLRGGAKINARDMEYRETPLTTAIRIDPNPSVASFEKRRESMVRLLLKHGASVTLPDDQPWSTSIGWAKRHGLENIAKLLQSDS